MRKIILMMMALAIAGCGERVPVSKKETGTIPEQIPEQKTNLTSQFSTGPRTPEDKFADVKQKAESGYAKDQLVLARMYYNGDGVTKDDAKAMEWWKKAAAQGNEAAHESLKQFSANGH